MKTKTAVIFILAFVVVFCLTLVFTISYLVNQEIKARTAEQAEISRSKALEQAEISRSKALEQAEQHLEALKASGLAFIFDSEEEKMREALAAADLGLTDLGLTDADIENLRIVSYRTTAVGHLESIQAQPLYAATYVGDNMTYYLDYIGESPTQHGVTEVELQELETCGFAILASRVANYESNDGYLDAVYKELGSYLEHRDPTKLSIEASIKLMDHARHGLETDPPCAPYL